MPPTKRTYLRPPLPDYAPNTAIRLGHLFRQPLDPGSFIAGSPLLPFPADMCTSLSHTRKERFTYSAGREKTGLVGAWLAFLEMIPGVGVSVEGGVTWERGDGVRYEVPVLETCSVEVSEGYVRGCVDLAVREGAVRRGENLYVVTGVKVAKGGEHEGGGKIVGRESVVRGYGVEAAVGVAGAPVGPEVGVAWRREGGMAFEGSDDFVFAYRVREIFYDKGVVRTREYNKGAVLGEGMVPAANGENGDGEVFVERAGLGDEDVVVDGEVYSFVDDDGQDCDMVI
jgi:hypothetical protein